MSTRLDIRITRVRLAFRILAWLYVCGLFGQVFLAGLAVWGEGPWDWHKNFVHILEFIPIIMAGLAFVGRLPSRMRWLTIVAVVQIAMQYALVKSGIGAVSALHAVNALLLFWVAVMMVQGTQRSADTRWQP